MVYPEIPAGANVKTLIFHYTDPTTDGIGNITLSALFVFANKVGSGVSQPDIVSVTLDPSGSLANMKTAVVNAILDKAILEGYSIAAADIMMPQYMKGV